MTSAGPEHSTGNPARSFETLAQLSSRSALQIAYAVGWTAPDLALRQVRRGGTELDVVRATVGNQPAALFARATARNGYDTLDTAALYAYHAAIEWGVLADDDGLTIFNAHWLLENDWFRLPRVRWGEAASRDDLRSALSPDGITDGALDRLASRQQEPTSFLQPVDDELVERLDNWREEALRYAKEARRVDDRLQTLFAQLFVLRTVEDRGLDPEVPPLTTVQVGPDRVDPAAWKRLFEAAQRRVGSDLFTDDVSQAIPPHVVAGVVQDLYKPRGLPRTDARYNFAWIEADVLGTAYEKYLSTVLQPAPPPPQMDLFMKAERGTERVSVRKRAGVYYTPRFITGYLAERCVEDFFAQAGGETPPRVIDFACGSGSFLVAAVDQILKRLKTQDPNRSWARELVAGRFIAGIDVDERAVTAARLHLWQRLVEEPNALPLPNLSDVVVAADGLKRDTWGALDHSYDIVLGNPPFLATSLIADRKQLETTFTTAKARYDFSYLFIEQAVNVLAPSGRLGMVAPNRLFRNRNGVSIRELLATQTDLLTLVDFGSTRPFADASAYIGCIVARRRLPGALPPDRVRVLQVGSLQPDFLAALMLKSERAEGDISSEAVRAYWTQHPSSGVPWSLLSTDERRSRVIIEEVSEKLEHIASVFQGIRTGGNDFFVFDVLSSDETSLCRTMNGLGDSAVLELGLLEPVTFGSELQRYQLVEPARRLLYPYRRNTVLPEEELKSRYPNTWAYLLRNRDLLAARASLQKSGGKWYELVWPRDEAWLRRPKLMIRDLAPRTAFALDREGTTFLVGGTAVVPQQPDMLFPLLGYLNSTVVDTLVRQTTPQFRGEFQKFEPQHILAIPVLNRVIEDPDFSSRLGSLATDVVAMRAEGAEAQAREREGEIDDLIRQVAGERGISLAA